MKTILRLVLVVSTGWFILGQAQPARADDPGQLAVGLRLGISVPNLTAPGDEQNPLNTGYSSRFGSDFGAFVELPVSGTFSLVPMLQFSAQGGKKNGLQALAVPDAVAPMFPGGQVPPYLYATYKSEAKLDYLLVPVLAKATKHLGASKYSVHVAVGPFAGFLLSAHQVTGGTSPLYLDSAGQQLLPAGLQSFDDNSDIKDQLRTFNTGVEGGLGVTYQRGRNAITLEGGGNYGFLNIQKGTANGKNNTGAAAVVVDYSYRLGR